MASSSGGSSEELPARLDSLLSSAIRERARDERALAEMFGSMRQDIEAFGRDIVSIKRLVQRPFQPILTLVGTKLAEMEQLVSDLRQEIFERLELSAETQNDRVAQESRTLGKFVEDWARYLDVRLKEQSAALAKLVEESAKSADGQLSRESAEIKSLVEHSAGKATEDLERHMEAAADRMSVMADQLFSHMTNAEEALRADVEVAQEALLEGIGESSEAVSDALHEVTSVVQKQIGQSVAEGLRPFSEQVELLANKIDEASRRMADSTGRLEAIQSSLIRYLAERDERLERVRDQALIDLVDKMSDSLKGRAKAKIVDALREGDQRRKDERDAARYRQASQTEGLPAKNPEDWPKDWIEADSGSDGGHWLSESK